MMLRPVTYSWFISLRRFGSTNLSPPSSLKPDAESLLNTVRVLATCGRLDQALSFFFANRETHSDQIYASLFHECARHGCLREGVSLHHYMVGHSPTTALNLYVTNHLLNMYCKCGYLDYARQLFDKMPDRNLISWTALISGYAQCGLTDKCCRLFSRMLSEYRPNEFAFASVLTSCVEGYARFGLQVHALALKMCLDACTYVGNSLITMYNRSGICDGTTDACTVFKFMEDRNTISWNSMISVFLFHGLRARAMDMFTQMHSKGISFDRTTLLSIFSSFLSSNSDTDVSFRFCSQLHCLTVKTGFVSEVKVATALIKAYSDLGGKASDCYKLFVETSCQWDIVSWTSIITIFAEQEPEKALFLFSQLCQESLTPDWYTYSIVLKACAGLVTDRHASAVHSQVIKLRFEGDTVLANSLIHAYARCGSISMSKQVFDEIEDRDIISWNSMIKAYALHGQAREALQLFSLINIKPDPTTFVALLSACSHAGLVEEGIKIFDCMHRSYSIVPQVDHYACMVDLYGRAGRIHEAEKLIYEMPMKPDSVIWSALIASCRKHGKTQLAKFAAVKLKQLEPRNSLGYVQMSNIQCYSGNFDEAGAVWNEMKNSRVRKEPGLSWVEVGNRVHEFASGGQRHPDRDVICSRLERLIGKLKEMGYVPETNLALYDLEEEQKEEHLYHHSEKLALMFSVINGHSNVRGSVIRIVKNIRICVDCHNFMKLASNLLRREIMVRDSNRFHHFKDGMCSCSDYW